MGPLSSSGTEGTASDWSHANRRASIGAGIGGAAGAVVGSSVAGSTTEGALLAGAGAAIGVIAVWLALVALS